MKINAGRKLESMLMMHDVICDNGNRWMYIRTIENLLWQVDPTRYTRLANLGYVGLPPVDVPGEVFEYERKRDAELSKILLGN